MLCFWELLKFNLSTLITRKIVVIMAAVIIIVVCCISALMGQSTKIYNEDDHYYVLPKFWTSTGFCPPGEIGSIDLKQHLLSDAVKLNLQHIASLPKGAITHVRIHWLLDLINFVSYTQEGVPIYDFDDLDTFITNMNDMGLYPVIEFMANPGNVFIKNPNRNDFLWSDFSYQVAKRYLYMLGIYKFQHWRFESWNEPDLSNYNTLNFTKEDFLSYMMSLHKGLRSVGKLINSHYSLRGPAGLFKADSTHPLCWSILQYCNENLQDCPINVLTYHRKGNGTAAELMRDSSELLLNIFKKYPQLKELPISNDEADPISIWSMPRPMLADVRYAHTLIMIVLKHWSALVHQREFKLLESISHDNAFLSYYPYEFHQRTLLAHFRMNLSQPLHSQFIQKPVYAALGLLGKLAVIAADLKQIKTSSGDTVHLLKTTVLNNEPMFLSWLILSNENASVNHQHTYNIEKKLPFEWSTNESYAFIVEVLEQENTDPAWIWHKYGSPPYPNSTVREEMRRKQSPIVHSTGLLTEPVLKWTISFKLPWIMLLRVCSYFVPKPKSPQQLIATEITKGEVLLTWREIPHTPYCLKTYEVWFKSSENNAVSDEHNNNWLKISDSWHIPFPSFQYAPTNAQVNGFYKIRAQDIFNRFSEYSETFWYIEL